MVRVFQTIILFFFILLLFPQKADARVFCGWECDGTNAVCKPGGDEVNELAPGCFCHEWCEGDGSKCSDVAPCQGSCVSCQGQWTRRTEGCCAGPEPRPTAAPTSIPTPTPTSIAAPTPTPTSIPTSTPTPTSTPIPASTSTPTPTSVPLYYFQVKGGDVHALFGNGDPVKSLMPTPPPQKIFLDDIAAQPGSAGVLSTQSVNNPLLGGGRLHSANWFVKNYAYPTARIYDYSYFDTNITNSQPVPGASAVLNGNSLSGITLPSGNNIWKISGDLIIDNISANLGVQIFLVSRNIAINSNLTVGTTTGTYPVFIAQNDITVDPNVETIGGIFITSTIFDTGSAGAIDKKFILQNGAIIAPNPIFGVQNINLNRLYSTGGEPAETFVYDPAYLIKLSNVLGQATHLWQEVNP